MIATVAAVAIGAHLYTHHFDEQFAGMKDFNPGAYARFDNGVTVGGFRNSFERTSLYLGYTWRTENDRFALTVAGTTGYAYAKVSPMFAPSVRIGLWEGFSARVAYVPRAPRIGAAHGLHLTVERSWP